MAIVDGRHEWRGIGDSGGNYGLFTDPPSNWFTEIYNEFLAGQVHKPVFSGGAVPYILRRAEWKNCYVNGSIVPTQAQAEDPNWSNYIWNRTGTPGSGLVYDGITAALNSPQVQNGSGPAKLAIRVGLTASGGPFNVPQFILNNNNWHWIDNFNTNGADAEYARLDVQAVVDHIKWFLTAFLAKFGGNRGIHMIQITEYYFGTASERPGNWSRAGSYQGMRQIWQHIDQAAPRDGNGARVNLLQVFPLFGEGGVTLQDLLDAKIGFATSDTYRNSTLTQEQQDFNAVYNAGLHTAGNGDSRYSRNALSQGNWANMQQLNYTVNGSLVFPTSGSSVATPQELISYSGTNGLTPMRSFCLARSFGANPGPQTLANYSLALDGAHLSRGGGPTPAPLAQSQGSVTVNGTPTIVGDMRPGVVLAYNHNLSSPDGTIAITGQQWERGVFPARQLVWTGPNFTLDSSHLTETFRIGVDFTVNGVAQPRKFSNYYGPVQNYEAIAIDFISDRTLTEGDTVQFQVSASGGTPPIQYSVSGLPPEANLDILTGQFTWTTGSGSAGTHAGVFSAADGQSSDSQSVTFTIEEASSGYPFYISAPKIKDTLATGHNIELSISQDGTVYGVRLSKGSAAPSSAQVKLGRDSSDANALEHVTIGALANALVVMSFNSADQDSEYDYYTVAENNQAEIQPSPYFIRALTAVDGMSGAAEVGGDDCGVFETRKIIEHAFRRCKIVPQRITSEYLETALDLLHMHLSTLQSEGITLWTIEKNIVPIYPGKSLVELPDGTIDLLDCNLRTSSRVVGSVVSSTQGYAENAFNGNLSDTCTHTSSGGSITTALSQDKPITQWGIMTNSTGDWDFVLESSSDGITYSTIVQKMGFHFEDATWYWFDLEKEVTGSFYRLRSINTTVLDIRELVFQNNPNETKLYHLSRDLYNNLPDKSETGRPTQYWYDKQADNPVIRIWPEAEDRYLFSQLICYTHMSVDENRNLPEKISIPARWQLSIIASLSSELAREIEEVDQGLLKALDEEAEQFHLEAMAGENDKVKASFLPRISQYTM